MTTLELAVAAALESTRQTPLLFVGVKISANIIVNRHISGNIEQRVRRRYTVRLSHAQKERKKEEKRCAVGFSPALFAECELAVKTPLQTTAFVSSVWCVFSFLFSIHNHKHTRQQFLFFF